MENVQLYFDQFCPFLLDKISPFSFCPRAHVEILSFGHSGCALIYLFRDYTRWKGGGRNLTLNLLLCYLVIILFADIGQNLILLSTSLVSISEIVGREKLILKPDQDRTIGSFIDQVDVILCNFFFSFS